LQLEIIAHEEEEVDIHRFPCASPPPPPKVEDEGFIFVAMLLDVNKEE